MRRNLLWLLLIFLFPAAQAFSSVALLLEQPFGSFGFFNPTGHAAIYLSNVCADSPTHLRRCRPGEYGVVISRYDHIDGYDWLAVPLVPYLYAVDTVSEIPQSASLETETVLRNTWRRKHLENLVPDTEDGKIPPGEWIQLIGSLYDRKIFVFEVKSADARDDALIASFNSRTNRRHFNLFFNNCADFSRRVLDFYYPHSVRRSYTADLGMTTPKQIAKSLTRYAARHELQLREFELPQVPGSISRSKHVDGVMEAMLRKNYLLPVAILHPYIAAGASLTYFTGRFDPSKHAIVLDEGNIVQAMWQGGPRPEYHGPSLIVPDLHRFQSGSALTSLSSAPMPDLGNSLPTTPNVMDFPEINPASATFR